MKKFKSAQINEIYSRIYPNHQMKNITFIVTHQCNLMCRYCYEHNKSDGRMPLDTAKRCVDFLFEQDDQMSELINPDVADGVILDFIGGEPFLEIELIDQTVSYFLTEAIKRKHRWAIQYMIQISTNGTLWDDPRIRRFWKKYAGRVSIAVTIDGDRNAHDACRVDCSGCGSYDRASRMFLDINRDSTRRPTKYTIAPGDIHLFASSIRSLITDLGCNDIHCNCVFEKGWEPHHATVLYHQLIQISDMMRSEFPDVGCTMLEWPAGDHLSETDTQNWCGGNARMLAFDIDGTILPCMRYSSISIPTETQPLYRIGDIEHGIGVLPEDRQRLDALQSITRQSQSTQECLDCPINRGCAWCTAYNYEMTGTPNKRVTYICEMHKAQVLAECYHHNKLYLEDPSNDPKLMNVPREWAIPIIGEEEYEKLRELERQATGTNAVE